MTEFLFQPTPEWLKLVFYIPFVYFLIGTIMTLIIPTHVHGTLITSIGWIILLPTFIYCKFRHYDLFVTEDGVIITTNNNTHVFFGKKGMWN